MLVIGRFFAAMLGFIAAVLAAATFLLAVEVGTTPADPAAADWFWALFTMSSLVTATAIGAFVAAPAALVILVAEIFALRSFVLYAAVGGLLGLAAASGVVFVSGMEQTVRIDATVLAAAGIVGGLVYWFVAGRTAGFASPRPPAARG